jgi:hypothetical protein
MRDKIESLLKQDANENLKLAVVSMFIGKAIEKLEERLAPLEERQLQKGDKGDRGEKGQDGKNGKDGRDGKEGKDGKPGIAGENGKNGVDGNDGVSVKDAYIAADGHFVFQMSDGREIDVGNPLDYEISARNVQINTQVAMDQITVSATAPTNPVLNQLWYDIS